MRSLARTGRGASTAIHVVGTVVLVVMTLHIVANALGRSWLEAPVPATIEVVSYWHMPAVAFLGMVVAKLDGSHTEASILFDRLPVRLQRPVRTAGQLLAAATCLVLAWFGLTEAWHSQQIGLTGGVTGLVVWPTTYLVPLCFAVLAVLFLVTGLRRPDREERWQ